MYRPISNPIKWFDLVSTTMALVIVQKVGLNKKVRDTILQVGLKTSTPVRSVYGLGYLVRPEGLLEKWEGIDKNIGPKNGFV